MVRLWLKSNSQSLFSGPQALLWRFHPNKAIRVGRVRRPPRLRAPKNGNHTDGGTNHSVSQWAVEPVIGDEFPKLAGDTSTDRRSRLRVPATAGRLLFGHLGDTYLKQLLPVLQGVGLGIGLGTSKLRKAVRAPSEATPDKRDIVFDRISHNPKVVGSNPTPATFFQPIKSTS
jgi:hypothetical protein